MGFFGDAWDYIKGGYNDLDKLDGGYLPGGVDPGDPARSGGQYEGLDRNNFNLPGYDQQQNRLNDYLGQVDNRQAPQLGAFQNAQASGVGAQQGQLAGMLMDRAQGNNSVAEQQLRQGLDLANRQQMSMMAGARPSNAAMAMRLGAQNMAQNSMGLTGQAALARAQESQMAAGQLGGLLGQQRAADEQLGMFNAGQQNQRTMTAAQMQQQQQAMNDAARAGLLGQSLNAAQMQQQGGMGYEQNRTSRYGAAVGVPTNNEVMMGGLSGLVGGAFGK